MASEQIGDEQLAEIAKSDGWTGSPQEITAMARELQERRASDEWIKCSDELPAEGQTVIMEGGIAYRVGSEWISQVVVPEDLRETYARAKDTKSFRTVNSSSLTCSLIERLGAAEQRHIDVCTKLNLALNERDRLKEQLATRDKLLHGKFGFVPAEDDPSKCACAYCTRDFEALADHAGEMEMQLYSATAKVAELEQQLSQEHPIADLASSNIVARTKSQAALAHMVRKETLVEALNACCSICRDGRRHEGCPGQAIRALIGGGV